MKTFLLAATLVISFNSLADIEYIPTDRKVPSAEKVESNRACFKELENQGCGDPGIDHVHFRSCMNNSYASLTESCQKLMTKLYGKK